MSNQIPEMGSVAEVLGQPLLPGGSGSATVGTILFATIIAIASLATAWFVKRLTVRHFERHDAGDEVAVQATARLLGAGVLLVGLDIVLHIFGLRLTSLFAAGGLFAVGAGFAAKNTVENYLSGIVLRLDRTIRRGDVVELEEGLLLIERIGLRSTITKTADGAEVLVPNLTLAGRTIKNLTREDRLVRVTALVRVAPDSDRLAVRGALEKVAGTFEQESAQAASEVVLEEFGAGSIVYSVSIWTDDVPRVKAAKSDLNEAIWSQLDAAGIRLA